MPRIDPFSFWLGFALATLVWWLLSRFKGLFPALHERFKRFQRELRERQLYGAKEYLRKVTLQRAQRWHLAADLFSLDSVIVPPSVLSPPPSAQDGQNHNRTESLVEGIIPYLPDWPELPSAYAYPRMDLARALSGGASLALIGRTGAGKTTALAHLACQIVRQEPDAAPLAGYASILCHILDLDLGNEPQKDPLRPIVEFMQRGAPFGLQSRVRRLIEDRSEEGRALLILDGLDDFSPSHLAEALSWLRALVTAYPNLQVIAAAAPDRLDGFIDLGFSPVALAAWTRQEYGQLLKRWSQAWSDEIIPNLKRRLDAEVDPALVELWLTPAPSAATPLEWTLKVWGAFAGDLQGVGSVNALNSHIQRYLTAQSTRPVLELLARVYLHLQQGAIPYPALVKALNQQAALSNSASEQLLSELAQSGLLVEHTGQMLRFASAAFAGLLASMHLDQDDLQQAMFTPQWPLNQEALHYLAAQTDEAAWIDSLITAEPSPLNLHLQIASRWLKDAPANATWKPQLFRALLGLVQNERLPDGLRARAIAAFSASNDASLPRLFHQLIGSASPSVRKLAVLGAGALADPSLVHDISGLLADQSEEVHLAACMSLVAIGDDQAMNVVAQTLLHGDETLRQAAAEAVALVPEIGVESIKEAAQVNDILTRRAAVFGLQQIGDAWALGELEKLAVEDSQWVVRNAASQALENLKSPNAHVPKPPRKPWDLPWLVAFAARQGRGVAPEQPVNDLVRKALSDGEDHEKAAALELAWTLRDQEIIQDAYDLLTHADEQVGEAALLAIWAWAVQGIQMPEPKAY